MVRDIRACRASVLCPNERGPIHVADQSAQGSSPQTQSDTEPKGYEEIVKRLGQVVEKLEGGNLSLEDSIAAFEEGIRLSRAGQRRLEEAEAKVEKLLEGDRTEPFASEGK
ncbi:MAG: exodeoxyribonuclease VII small subunit [Deltaproteobacteria bacterium]|nr:exodeoxyribonuclease VII small subunit [Deltaproteobacteria bacterium]